MAQRPQFAAERVGTPIRAFSAIVRGLTNTNDVRKVVGALTIGHLDSMGREITNIGNFSMTALSARLDRQGNASDGAANLQVQVNNSALEKLGSKRSQYGTTVAQVTVPRQVYDVAMKMPATSGVRAQLENVVRAALLSSYASLGFPFRIVQK